MIVSDEDTITTRKEHVQHKKERDAKIIETRQHRANTANAGNTANTDKTQQKQRLDRDAPQHFTTPHRRISLFRTAASHFGAPL